MSFTVHGQPTGAMRLAQPLLKRALRRQFAAHCATLKRVLETWPFTVFSALRQGDLRTVGAVDSATPHLRGSYTGGACAW
jgi:hypothetical protein